MNSRDSKLVLTTWNSLTLEINFILRNSGYIALVLRELWGALPVFFLMFQKTLFLLCLKRKSPYPTFRTQTSSYPHLSNLLKVIPSLQSTHFCFVKITKVFLSLMIRKRSAFWASKDYWSILKRIL